MEQIRTENKMGTMPVGRLLANMAVPMMISMLVQALYNVVDSIYVAQLSQDALNAVSLSFPIQNLMIALGSGIGVGMNALLSKSLGEKNYEQAFTYIHNLKGLAMNLGLTPLLVPAQELCEELRDGEPERELKPLLDEVAAAYQKVLGIVERLD